MKTGWRGRAVSGMVDGGSVGGGGGAAAAMVVFVFRFFFCLRLLEIGIRVVVWCGKWVCYKCVKMENKSF